MDYCEVCNRPIGFVPGIRRHSPEVCIDLLKIALEEQRQLAEIEHYGCEAALRLMETMQEQHEAMRIALEKAKAELAKSVPLEAEIEWANRLEAAQVEAAQLSEIGSACYPYRGA